MISRGFSFPPDVQFPAIQGGSLWFYFVVKGKEEGTVSQNNEGGRAWRPLRFPLGPESRMSITAFVVWPSAEKNDRTKLDARSVARKSCWTEDWQWVVLGLPFLVIESECLGPVEKITPLPLWVMSSFNLIATFEQRVTKQQESHQVKCRAVWRNWVQVSRKSPSIRHFGVSGLWPERALLLTAYSSAYQCTQTASEPSDPGHGGKIPIICSRLELYAFLNKNTRVRVLVFGIDQIPVKFERSFRSPQVMWFLSSDRIVPLSVRVWLKFTGGCPVIQTLFSIRAGSGERSFVGAFLRKS